MNVEPRLTNLIARHLGAPDDEITPTASLIDDLGCDSLDIVEVVMAIEDEYSIKISDDEADGIVTVQDAALLIDRLVAAQAAPAK